MTNKDKPHGALGSNAPLERVPVEDDAPAEKEEETVDDASVATPFATKKDDEDVVYLREDLKPSGS
jgi:hypothetical protein